MNILLVGANEVFAIEVSYCKYLNDLGIKTNLFAATSIFLCLF